MRREDRMITSGASNVRRHVTRRSDGGGRCAGGCHPSFSWRGRPVNKFSEWARPPTGLKQYRIFLLVQGFACIPEIVAFVRVDNLPGPGRKDFLVCVMRHDICLVAILILDDCKTVQLKE